MTRNSRACVAACATRAAAKIAPGSSHERLGYNYRLSELHCALGLAQLNGSTNS